MPAPTESRATSVRPAGSPEAARGCSTSILSPVRFGSFIVETTSPSTRASCTLVLDLDGVDDTDDGGVDRAVLQTGRHAGGTAADDEHRLAEAGGDGVDGDEIVPLRLPARIDRPRDEQLAADETLVFPRRHDGSYHFRENHERKTQMPNGKWQMPKDRAFGIRHSTFVISWLLTLCRWAARPRGSRGDAGSRGPRRARRRGARRPHPRRWRP